MESITGLIQTAMVIVVSIAAVVGAIFGAMVYIRHSGQEEGE